MLQTNQQNEIAKEKHRLDFFRPDQVVFLVTHDPTVDATELMDEKITNEILQNWGKKFKEYLSQSAKYREWRLDESLQLRMHSFPALGAVPDEVPDMYRTELFNGASFSMIFCNMLRPSVSQNSDMESNNNAEDPGIEINANPAETYYEEKKKKRKPKETNEERASAKIQLLNFITQLDEEHESLNFVGLTTQAVIPNWISSSSASDSGGTGGPGGYPAPYTGSLDQVPYYFKNLIFQLQEKQVYGDGTGIDVVILDTVPPKPDLVLAYKELAELKEDGHEHPLIKDLLGPNGRLIPYHATYNEQLRMGNTSLNKHGYKMADHGLFIAGIIHSIVPKATIHLIEVLNQFGVGDLETITTGLEKAYAIYLKNQGRVVINCSLCLDVPDVLKKFLYHEGLEEVISDKDRDLEETVWGLVNGTTNADDLRWVIALRAACERLGKAGRQIVAAAGNDSRKKPEAPRDAPGARYPAAFRRVVGVGALPKDARPDTNNKYEASSFSNLADKPAQTGIMTLGGESGAGNGVLGLYLGEFPPESFTSGKEVGDTKGTDAGQALEAGTGQAKSGESGHTRKEFGWDKTGPKSENGWAWWSGTSFATPILTAAIASVLSHPGGPRITQAAIQVLYDTCIIENRGTLKDEDVMPSSLVQEINPSEMVNS